MKQYSDIQSKVKKKFPPQGTGNAPVFFIGRTLSLLVILQTQCPIWQSSVRTPLLLLG